jgi:hypothetical protein
MNFPHRCNSQGTISHSAISVGIKTALGIKMVDALSAGIIKQFPDKFSIRHSTFFRVEGETVKSLALRRGFSTAIV